MKSLMGFLIGMSAAYGLIGMLIGHLVGLPVLDGFVYGLLTTIPAVLVILYLTKN